MFDSIMKNKNIHIYILLIILTCLITYFNSLTTGFLFLDDYTTLKFVKSTHFSFKGLFLPTEFDRYYRPIVGISGLFDFYLFADNSAGYHLTNVMIHLLNSVLVFFLALEVTREIQGTEEIALLSSLFFAIHPLNSEPVIWISARADLFFCFFSLVFLILLSKNKPHIKTIPLVCMLMLYLCSLLSKESGIMLFPLAILFLLVERKKVTDKDSIALIAGMLIATVCYFLLRTGMNTSGDVVLGKVASIGTAGASVLKNMAACGFYVRKMIYPYPLNIAITNIPVNSSLIVFGTTVPAMLYLYHRHKALLIPALIISTGLLPALISLNVHASWTPYAERYMYVPMAGFSILIGYCLMSYAKRIPIIILLSGTLLLSIPTIYRISEWSDPISFWQATATKTPASATVRILLAGELMNAGRYDEAEKQLTVAKSIGFVREKDKRSYNEFLADLDRMRH